MNTSDAALLWELRAVLEHELQAWFDREPCGCPECSYNIQPGHFACSSVSEDMLRREATGEAARTYDDGAWRWLVTEPRSLSAALREYIA
jgi:hypothetical protein